MFDERYINFRISGEDSDKIISKIKELKEKKQLSKVLNNLIRGYFESQENPDNKNMLIFDRLKCLTNIFNVKKNEKRTMLNFICCSICSQEDLEYLENTISLLKDKKYSLKKKDLEEQQSEEIQEETQKENHTIVKQAEKAEIKKEPTKEQEQTGENLLKKNKEENQKKFLNLDGIKEDFFD